MMILIIFVAIVWLMTVLMDDEAIKLYLVGALIFLLLIFGVIWMLMGLTEKGNLFIEQVSYTLVNTTKPVKIMINNSALSLVKDDIIWAKRRGVKVNIILNRDDEPFNRHMLKNIRHYGVKIRLNALPQHTFKNIMVVDTNNCLDNEQVFLWHHYKSSSYYMVASNKYCSQQRITYKHVWRHSVV